MLIGEVSTLSGVSPRMLRHYDALGLVRPAERTAGGYRRYGQHDLARLFHVEALRSLGLELREIAAALADLSFDPGAVVAELIDSCRSRIDREQTLLRRLEQVRAGDPDDWSEVLRLIESIKQLAADEPSVRLRRALRPGAADDGDLRQLVEAALAEEDLNTAGALDWTLSRRGDAAVPLFVAAAHSGSARRRRRAAEALCRIGVPAAADALAEMIDHADPFVRGRAALHLGARGAIEAVPGLLELIVTGRDDVDAADTLAGLATGPDRAGEITTAIAGRLVGASADQRGRLTQSLADVPGGRADALLAALTRDPDRTVAVTAEYLAARRRG